MNKRFLICVFFLSGNIYGSDIGSQDQLEPYKRTQPGFLADLPHANSGYLSDDFQDGVDWSSTFPRLASRTLPSAHSTELIPSDMPLTVENLQRHNATPKSNDKINDKAQAALLRCMHHVHGNQKQAGSVRSGSEQTQAKLVVPSSDPTVRALSNSPVPFGCTAACRALIKGVVAQYTLFKKIYKVVKDTWMDPEEKYK